MLHNKKKLFCIILTAVLLTACGDAKEQEVPELLMPIEAKQEMQKVVITDIYDCSYFDSEVTAVTVTAGFKRSGYIEQIYVRIGDSVKKGDLLGVLDSKADMTAIEEQNNSIADAYLEYDNQIEELEARIDKIKIELIDTEGKEQKLKKLELEELETSLEYNRVLFEQKLAAMNQELEKLKENAVGYELYSPAEGTVTCIGGLSAGSRVSAGQDQFVIADTNSPCIITTKLTEDSLADYDKIQARIGAEVYDLELFDYSTEEKNSYVYSGKTIPVRFKITTTDLKDKIGLYCAIILYQNRKEQVLAIPSGAILTGESGEYVYVNRNGEKEYRKITTGIKTVIFTEITEGLTEGEEVFLHGTALTVSDNYSVTEVMYDSLTSTKQFTGASLGYTGRVSIDYREYGTVGEVFVKTGDYVEKGTALMTISKSQDRMQLLNAEISLKTAENEYQAEIARRESEIDTLEKKAETEKTEQLKKIAACEAKIQTAELAGYIYENEAKLQSQRKEYLELVNSASVTLTASCSGYIEYIATKGSMSGYWSNLGSIISSEIPVLLIDDSSKILKFNQKVKITQSMDKEKTYEGTVIYASNIVPNSLWSGTAIVRVDEFEAGMNMDYVYSVEAVQFELDHVLTVDYAAVSSGEAYSVLLSEDGMISTQLVNFGRRFGEKAWILGGLSEGQKLVIR